ncbi:hypothetical protein SOM61_25570 [Massilia sp. CFBP9012]|uniref:hypothetical protein n=1 Tax=Massilia sp. CFBP9012 TaxID=3096531 RepID=UPI002A69D6DC|nr:hypothetical protein [Massilia sp. CFBP9012]MDY0978337.1 hypothetical protein [Massilia sp. CFBP9012]
MTGNARAEQITVNDIEVGMRVYEALAHHAGSSQGAPIGYKDLLTFARSLHPKDLVLGRAVPIGIGMKLRFVDAFCAAHGYPRLSSLAVDQESMLPAKGYDGDWDADRRAAAAFDWSSADAQLPAFASAQRAAVPARLKPRKERPADVSWYAYFCSHRKECEWIGQEDKHEIINLIMAGLDPETAFGRVKAARADAAGPTEAG